MPDIVLFVGTGTNTQVGKSGLPRGSTMSYQEEEEEELSNTKPKLKNSRSLFPIEM